MPRFLLLLLCTLPITVFGQQKFERESRIRIDEVPETAQQFLQAGQIAVKVKWYYEENLEGNSIEAKFRQERKRFSVEFDTLGQIQDIEVEIAQAELPAPTLLSIERELGSRFTRFKLQKIQVQYLDTEPTLAELLIRYPAVGEAQVRYEIVLKGRNEEGTALYECTFDQSGKLLEQQQIIFKNANHLEY
ncbi:MAG: hypothetical protein AAFZ63_02950 [Bacteroidota bacterium]